MDLDKVIFKTINSYKMPSIFDNIFAYLHGFINIEIIFFLFSVILFLIVVVAPKKGPRAVSATFIVTMITYFGMDNVKKLLLRPYPVLSNDFKTILRVEVMQSVSAFPVMSTFMFAVIIMSIIFYFERYSIVFIFISLIYAMMPIYLGFAYPSDAFGSLILGFVLSYIFMQFLSKIQYFSR